MGRQALIVIAGPTAVGKSELAAEVGRRIDGEVISADSMQVYRYMDIGSAKITLEEMLGVPHHMIDVVDPFDEMDAARYAAMARKCIQEIAGRGHIPILCGGTGFYIQAVTRNIDFTEMEPDPAYRSALQEYAEVHGNAALHEQLRQADPAAAEAIHPNNVKRVIRALEFYHLTGRQISGHNAAQKLRETPYDLHFFVIEDEREALYERIDKRVDFMIGAGLMDEVAYLKAMGLGRQHVSMQGLGYKEMLDFLDGRISFEEAVRIIKRDSRHYAKRQLTWFRRERDAVRLNRADFGGSTERVMEALLRELKDRAGIAAKEVGRPYE